MNRKGIILAGGLGTRLFPLTRAISKQLLPVYDKPMVYYPLSTLMLAGIREVLIITTEQERPRFEQLLGDGSKLGMSLSYKVQSDPKGISEAFILGEEFIGNSSVTLVLGDNIFCGEGLESLLKNPELDTRGATVFAKEVAAPEKYGVVHQDENGKVIKLLEKPKEPPTNLAVTGLYFYDNDVVEIAKEVKPSHRGELEITDINNIYLEKEELHVSIFGEGVTWFDTGGFDALLEAACFVKEQQEKGFLVGAIEKIAYQNGWINHDQLQELCLSLEKSGYGHKIISL
ncbi:glucose-1-phosphate thymidylyltransferase RfbA [bacterium]|nr:glucose-1-phosphate thymidylyltransferase RfbA [bacterium]